MDSLPEPFDDDLTNFESHGAPPLPTPATQGHLPHDGALLYHATFGPAAAPPVLLLHGGLGHSGNFAHQLPALLAAGYRVTLLDTRGHGRSTRDPRRPYSYDLLASDTLAVLDALHIDRAPLIGWSDGACTALVLAAKAPERVAGIFFFACNMDPTGTKPFEMTPTIGRCFSRHTQDYAALSPTPNDFQSFVDAVSLMQRTQPTYSAADLSRIQVPITIAHAEHDEFIKREHAEYLAQTIPNAKLLLLEDVSHFAPLQRPAQFNAALLTFLAAL